MNCTGHNGEFETAWGKNQFRGSPVSASLAIMLMRYKYEKWMERWWSLASCTLTSTLGRTFFFRNKVNLRIISQINLPRDNVYTLNDISAITAHKWNPIALFIQFSTVITLSKHIKASPDIDNDNKLNETRSTPRTAAPAVYVGHLSSDQNLFSKKYNFLTKLSSTSPPRQSHTNPPKCLLFQDGRYPQVCWRLSNQKDRKQLRKRCGQVTTKLRNKYQICSCTKIHMTISL